METFSVVYLSLVGVPPRVFFVKYLGKSYLEKLREKFLSVGNLEAVGDLIETFEEDAELGDISYSFQGSTAQTLRDYDCSSVFDHSLEVVIDESGTNISVSNVQDLTNNAVRDDTTLYFT